MDDFLPTSQERLMARSLGELGCSPEQYECEMLPLSLKTLNERPRFEGQYYEGHAGTRIVTISGHDSQSEVLFHLKGKKYWTICDNETKTYKGISLASFLQSIKDLELINHFVVIEQIELGVGLYNDQIGRATMYECEGQLQVMLAQQVEFATELAKAVLLAVAKKATVNN